MVKRDYAGFDRILLDSLKKHDIFRLKHREMRAIPTLVSNTYFLHQNGKITTPGR